MQIITLIGRLTKDATVRTSNKNVKREFVSFSLACNEQKGDEKSTTFYDLTMPKTGILDYLKKGQIVSVMGRFRYEVTEDENGKQHAHLNVSVMDIELIASSKKSESENAPVSAEENQEA